MLTPEQCRAARGWLSWSQQALADQASISLSTVRDFETGKRSPIANNLAAMQRVFEQAGIEFLFENDGSPLGILGRGNHRRY
jgi:transcriptional regulator with XRE-family HTH domain